MKSYSNGGIWMRKSLTRIRADPKIQMYLTYLSKTQLIMRFINTQKRKEIS